MRYRSLPTLPPHQFYKTIPPDQVQPGDWRYYAPPNPDNKSNYVLWPPGGGWKKKREPVIFELQPYYQQVLAVSDDRKLVQVGEQEWVYLTPDGSVVKYGRVSER